MFEPPSQNDILRLRAWLQTAELPDPPMVTMPGVEAWSPELTRQQLLALVSAGDPSAVLELRYLAARYGPPEIAAPAKPDQFPGDPRGPQVEPFFSAVTGRGGQPPPPSLLGVRVLGDDLQRLGTFRFVARLGQLDGQLELAGWSTVGRLPEAIHCLARVQAGTQLCMLPVLDCGARRGPRL